MIGTSEEGRPIQAVVFGRGPLHVSLVAGAHADEPVGPAMLRLLVAQSETLGPYLDEFTFHVVPHVNPDGEARNRAWIEQWPDPDAYRKHVVREPPGRDIEFGYPDMRPENRAVAAFLAESAPYVLHMSLHGMSAAEGGMLLVERHWVDRTPDVRSYYRSVLEVWSVGVHDHDRKGEKGFDYLGPGFWTTPEGAAMRAHFEQRGDPETAALFRDSSMEYVRSLGGDPLCLVTEIPLFLVPNPDPRPGVPTAYLNFMKRWGEPGAVEAFGVRPVELKRAIALQLVALELGLLTRQDSSRTSRR